MSLHRNGTHAFCCGTHGCRRKSVAPPSESQRATVNRSAPICSVMNLDERPEWKLARQSSCQQLTQGLDAASWAGHHCVTALTTGTISPNLTARGSSQWCSADQAAPSPGGHQFGAWPCMDKSARRRRELSDQLFFLLDLCRQPQRPARPQYEERAVKMGSGVEERGVKVGSSNTQRILRCYRNKLLEIQKPTRSHSSPKPQLGR